LALISTTLRASSTCQRSKPSRFPLPLPSELPALIEQEFGTASCRQSTSHGDEAPRRPKEP
jgi:hypothetical protein